MARERVKFAASLVTVPRVLEISQGVREGYFPVSHNIGSGRIGLRIEMVDVDGH
jgi:hypothetical protein